jgi:putative methyltransferase (TIGR04325 family)
MEGVSTVLDFGSGCGLPYKLAAQQSPAIRWAVVETPAMVAQGSKLATDKVRFVTHITSAAEWLGPIEVMHSNGALQYVPHPMQTLSSLCRLGANMMLWHRMYLSHDGIETETQSSQLIDNGPGQAPLSTKNKVVRYTRTSIPESAFIDAHEGYRLEHSGNGSFKFIRLP